MSPDLKTRLTPRELKLFLLLIESHPKVIAGQSDLKPCTIAWNINNIGMKLGTTHRGVWMRWAIEQGLVTLSVS